MASKRDCLTGSRLLVALDEGTASANSGLGLEAAGNQPTSLGEVACNRESGTARRREGECSHASV